MKHLANCTPREFLAQSAKIAPVLENWLKKTDIMGIRKRQPVIPINSTKEEREELTAKQARQNILDMFKTAVQDCPEETIELLGALCFTDSKHIDDYPMDDYFSALFEMVDSKAVTGFFTSFSKLGTLMNT